METVTAQFLDNSSREMENRLDTLRATKGVHVEVVQNSAVFILQVLQCVLKLRKHSIDVSRRTYESPLFKFFMELES